MTDIVCKQGIAGQADIRRAVHQIAAQYELLWPGSRDALVLIKPNLNNDLSALTGNSTDLRLLAAVIELLQQHGWTRIVVGDGPNIGTYRKGMDVLGRLGVRALCAHYGVECIDLNRAPVAEVRLATGRARVARLCLEADLFINLPKLKTHAEAGMSLAAKSLIGCVVGTDKRKVHADLPANIVALNEAIHPHLIIADALIAMEGNGPGDGVPRRVNTLLAATDPFALDLAAAHLFGLNPADIPYLTIAHKRGHITAADLEAAARLAPLLRLEPAPPRGRLARLLDSRALAPVRDATRIVHGQEWARQLLYRLHILQDVYEAQDACIEQLWLDQARCTRCGLCLNYCPLALPVLDAGFDFISPCTKCLYCFQVCPEQAIKVEGELGYLQRHLERYGVQVRQVETLRFAEGDTSNGTLDPVNILGVHVHRLGMTDLIQAVVQRAKSGARSTVLYANVHVLNTAYGDEGLQRILNQADLVYCDGAGVRLGARLLGFHLPPRMTGADWIEPLCAACAAEGITLYLLGSRPGVAGRAAELLQRRHPALRIAGTQHGYLADPGECTAAITSINAAHAHILLVGMGTPIQERWIAAHRDELEVPVVWGVGALFDFVAGIQPRGPRWMLDSGLEWLYRLCSDPRRLWQRYLVGNPLFILRILRQKLS